MNENRVIAMETYYIIDKSEIIRHHKCEASENSTSLKIKKDIKKMVQFAVFTAYINWKQKMG